MRIVSAVLLSLLMPAFALAHGNTKTNDQLSGVGGPYWTYSETVGTGGACITVATSTVCAPFPMGQSAYAYERAYVITALGSLARCGWVMDTNVTVDADMQIADAAGANDGPGSTFIVPVVGVIKDQMPHWDSLVSIPGSRAGICDTQNLPDRDGNETKVYMPCDAAADCAIYAGSAALCKTGVDITDDMKDHVAAILWCEGDDAATAVIAEKQLVPKDRKRR